MSVENSYDIDRVSFGPDGSWVAWSSSSNNARSVMWSRNLPKHLVGFFECTFGKYSKEDVSLTYFTLGPSGEYYLKLSDGTSKWSHPDEVVQYRLKNNVVQEVAFGEDHAYVILDSEGF